MTRPGHDHIPSSPEKKKAEQPGSGRPLLEADKESGNYEYYRGHGNQVDDED